MSPIPTISWDENNPDGDDPASQGEDRIKEFKTQVREVLEVDHQFNSSGQDAENGKHKKVSFQEQADLGTGSTGKTLLGGQTVGGKPELVYTDEDDNDIQITSLGKIKAENLSGVYPASALGDVVNILSFAFPIGSVYINATDSTNPATLLGFGTWTAWGVGKSIVGIDTSDTDFDTAEETGGAKTHTLTKAELPNYQIDTGLYLNNTGGSSGPEIVNSYDNTGSSYKISSGGSGTAFSTLDPYQVGYVWKRTA